MKQKLSPRWAIIKLTGLFFAAYSAYNVFIIFRDAPRGLSSEGILISALVAFMFALLAGYALTFGVNKKKGLFLMIRKTSFIIALLTIFVLKLRMIDRIVMYMQPPDLYNGTPVYAVLYGISYFLTLTGFLILLVYYIFFRRRYLLFPRTAVSLPAAALGLFVCSLVLETILFFGYGFMIEDNLLRTVVMRPVFYLGFIGLSAYFLYPPQLK